MFPSEKVSCSGIKGAAGYQVRGGAHLDRYATRRARSARTHKKRILTDVGVLQFAADAGLALQLLEICATRTRKNYGELITILNLAMSTNARKSEQPNAMNRAHSLFTSYCSTEQNQGNHFKPTIGSGRWSDALLVTKINLIRTSWRSFASGQRGHVTKKARHCHGGRNDEIKKTLPTRTHCSWPTIASSAPSGRKAKPPFRVPSFLEDRRRAALASPDQ